MDAMKAREFALQPKQVADTLWHLKRPVIAAGNGLRPGGGFEYALACEPGIVCETAKFELPEINPANRAGNCRTRKPACLIGLVKAGKLCLTGATIDAGQAFSLAILNAVCPQETPFTQPVTMITWLLMRCIG